jgi:HEAT repeat protein
MTLRSLSASLLACVLVASSLSACQETDPKKPETWIAKLDQKDPKKVVDAAHELRKLKAKEAVQPLVALLKHEDMNVRLEAAYALEDIGDPSAMQPLIDAIDLASTAKASDQANAKIAEALGSFGDAKATPALIRMLGAREATVKLAAVKGLGKVKDPAAIPALRRFIDDEATAPLITKTAIQVLGEMRATEAVPSIVKAMVMERQGVSFYSEASYALFQIGDPAAKALIAILNGSDTAYLKWADDRSRLPAGYLSKGAVILADIGDKSAVPALVKLMTWKDPAENEAYELLVHGQAGEALGRLRAKEGAAAIGAQVNVSEANIRGQLAVALAHIGDKAQLPKLEAAAKNPKDTWGARQEAINGLVQLGDAKNKATLEGIIKTETPDASVKHCLAEETSEDDARKEARCAKERTARPQFLADALATLLAGEECKAATDCWVGKLKDKNARVRERAAYTLGALQDPAAVDALVGVCKDEELGVRRAAYIALDWMSAAPAAKAAVVAKRDQLTAQYDEESGHAHTVIVNEDLKRVIWKLKQL